MNDQDSAPDTTFTKLISLATDIRRKRSLEALHTTCKLLSERGSRDFSYRNIITLGKDRGLAVPSQKTIVNQSGEHYRELIHSWRVFSNPPEAGLKGVDWMENIKDPALRMSVLMLNAELKAMKAKEARKSMTSGVPIIIGRQEGQPISPLLHLNGSELAALKASIDPDFLRLTGLSLQSRGEIVDTAGRNVMKPGFRDAIEKILTVHKL